MNINKVGSLTLMTGIALIIAPVVSACGNDTGTARPTTTTTITVPYGSTRSAPSIPPPMPVGVIQAGKGTADSFWIEMAGQPLSSTGFVADVHVDGPLYGPSASAGNFDAVARVGSKCVVAFATVRGTGDGRFGTTVYVERGGVMTGYFVDDQTVDEANKLIDGYRPYC